MLENEPHAGPRSIRLQLSLSGWNKSIEKHLFDASVIVKIFDVAET
jgi:hypothetical protein